MRKFDNLVRKFDNLVRKFDNLARKSDNLMTCCSSVSEVLQHLVMVSYWSENSLFRERSLIFCIWLVDN